MQCYIAWLSGICLFSVVKVSALRNLLRFLANYNHWLLFVLLEAVSVVLLFRYNSYQGSTWISSANFVSGKIYEWSSEVESFFSLIGTNRNLTERNLAVEQENASLRQQLYDATHDSLVFTVRKNLPIGGLKTISARVVSNTVNRPDNLITIDKGSADGVRAECDVVGRSVRAQMKYADKIGAKFSVMIGDSELESGTAKLKDMQGKSEPADITLGEDFGSVFNAMLIAKQLEAEGLDGALTDLLGEKS